MSSLAETPFPQDPPIAFVRAQLDRLQASPVFEKSERLMLFLRHIVEMVLAGESRYLTESGVGNAVYGRTREYDARIDSTVRVEARRLRKKLTEYYAAAGRRDPVTITLPVGSYVPVIAANDVPQDEDTDVAAAFEPPPIFRGGPGAAIVVLPLRALSNVDDECDFAEGLSDELTFSMARAPGLRVVSRSTTAQALKLNCSGPTLAAELGVDAVVQGTVRRHGAVMRVTLEVSDPKGFIVWSDRLDLPDGERTRLQELFAATMLSRLRLDSSRMKAKLIGPGPEALHALGRIYSARQLLDQQTPASLSEALDQFKHVAAMAPDYARGHSGIADCYCDMYRLGLVDQATARRAARAAAERALSIDPASIEAHGALGTVHGWLEWNRYDAEEHFRTALRYGESSRAARAYGVLLALLGRHEEAAHLLWEARQMEPFSIQQDIAEAVSCFQLHRFSHAIEVLADVPPSRVANEALVYVALSHVFEGDQVGARAVLARINQHVSKHPDLIYAREELAAWLGDPAAAIARLAESTPGATHYARATLAVAAGDDEAALLALAAALKSGELSAVWLRSDPRFDRLRGSSTFDALVAELNRLSIDRFEKPIASTTNRKR